MAISNKNLSGAIRRRAINSSGCLGSLYNGYRDRLIQQCSINVKQKSLQIFEQLRCELISGDNDASKNLLQWIGIQDELRLSLLLRLTRRDGISAVLNYPHPIDRHTRFLYYSLITYTNEFATLPDIHAISELWNPNGYATHIITEVHFGIDLLVVMQLPSEFNISNRIDSLLKKIQDILSRGKTHLLQLNSTENNLLQYIISTQSYSNITSLPRLTNVSDILNKINLVKQNYKLSYPFSYTLELITAFYPQNMIPQLAISHPLHMIKTTSFSPVCPLLNNIEKHMLDCRNVLKYGETFLEKNVLDGFHRNHQHVFREACNQISWIKDIYVEKMEQLFKFVTDARGGKVSISEIHQVLFNHELIMKEIIKKLTENLMELKVKDPSIRNSPVIQHRFVIECLPGPILDVRDNFNKNNQSKLVHQYQRPTREEKHNSVILLQNANAPSFSSEAKNEAISLSKQTDYDENYSQQKISSSKKSPQPSTTAFSSRPSSVDETINILLVGETGVGKSTFINAFANYLAFDVFDQAELNEPIVIIPVSFIMTIGDNFEEQTVKFGEVDSRDNENFNNVGQSVTQHCKSYVFDLKDNGKRLRIIDTPGFGDTRGLEQDDQNMDHILQYINNLTHLNAICFLLKSNSSRLNMFFRTCLTQLFSFLAPTARDNVIFCFTNARSTFYTPGDTAPLLKTVLASSSIDGISFRKDNTFCFDNKAFRYLVALRNDIPFNEEDKHEYEKGWSTSLKQSHRLIEYIHRNLVPYYICNQFQSVKHAQFEIHDMIRPILQTIQNIHYNLIFCRTNLSKQLIKLRLMGASRPMFDCFSCKCHLTPINQYSIISDSLLDSQNKCHICSRSATRHVPIDYESQYDVVSNSSIAHSNEMNKMLHRLYLACAEFSHFLIHRACSTKNDLFMSGLSKMIREKKNICHKNQSDLMNLQLIYELEIARHEYEQRMHDIISNQHPKNLITIYEQIKIVNTYPVIYDQMNAIKQRQKELMKKYEVII